MIIWINGAFGSGKTTAAYELNRRLPNSFVYDPENAGYFIRRNTNGLFAEGDFQDIPLWREMNYKTLSMIAEKYDGTIIVPMTIVSPIYYDEIIGKLAADGHDVKHYILYAKPDEIKRRLKKRSFLFIRNEDFALSAIDRCINAFDKYIPEVKIYTDNMSINDVVDRIAKLASLQLTPNKTTGLGRYLYRKKMTRKHT